MPGWLGQCMTVANEEVSANRDCLLFTTSISDNVEVCWKAILSHFCNKHHAEYRRCLLRTFVMLNACAKLILGPPIITSTGARTRSSPQILIHWLYFYLCGDCACGGSTSSTAGETSFPRTIPVRAHPVFSPAYDCIDPVSSACMAQMPTGHQCDLGSFIKFCLGQRRRASILHTNIRTSISTEGTLVGPGIENC